METPRRKFWTTFSSSPFARISSSHVSIRFSFHDHIPIQLENCPIPFTYYPEEYFNAIVKDGHPNSRTEVSNSQCYPE